MALSDAIRRYNKVQKKEYDKDARQFIEETKAKKKAGYIETAEDQNRTSAILRTLARNAAEVSSYSRTNNNSTQRLFNLALNTEKKYMKSQEERIKKQAASTKGVRAEQATNRTNIFGTANDPRANMYSGINAATNLRNKKIEAAQKEREELESLSKSEIDKRLADIETKQKNLSTNMAQVDRYAYNNPNATKEELQAQVSRSKELKAQYQALEDEKAKYNQVAPAAAAREEENKLTEQEKNLLHLYTNLKRETRGTVDGGLADALIGAASSVAKSVPGGAVVSDAVQDWQGEKDVKNEEKYQQEFDKLRDKGVDVDYLLEYYKTQKDNEEQEQANRANERIAGASVLSAIANSAASVIASPLAGLQGLGEDIGHAIKSTDEKPLPINQRNRSLANYNQSARKGVSDNIDNSVWNFIYNAGMSTADSAAAIGLGLATGGTGAVGSAVTQGIMSVGAADQTYNDAIERGIDPGRAMTTGILAGVTEWVTEKYSIDGLKRMALNKPNNIRQLVSNIGKQMATEGSEEAASDVMNTIVDNVVNGKKSEYNLAVKQYREQGLSIEQAKKAAMMDWLGNTVQDAAAGAFSGALMGAGGQAASFKQINNSNNNKGESIKALGDTNSIIDYAKTLGNEEIDKQADKTSKKLFKDGEELETGRLADAIEEHIVSEIESATDADELSKTYERLSENAPDSIKISIDDAVTQKASELSESAETTKEKTALKAVAESAFDSYETISESINERLNNADDSTEYDKVEDAMDEGVIANKETDGSEPAILTRQAPAPVDNGGENINDTIEPKATNEGGHDVYKVAPKVFANKEASLKASGEPIIIEGFSKDNKGNVKLKIDDSTDEVDFDEVSFKSNSTAQIYRVAAKMDDAAAASALVSNYNAKYDTAQYVSDFERAFNWGTVGYDYDSMKKKSIFLMPESVVRLAYELGKNNYNRYAQEEIQRGKEIKENKKVYKKGESKVTDERKNTEDFKKDVYDNIDEKLAKRLGIDIKQVDKITPEQKDVVATINGQLDLANAEMTFSELAESKLGVRIHESLELMDAVDPLQYNNLMQYVLNFAIREENSDKDIYETIEEYRKTYKGLEGTKTFREAAKEYFNDAVSGVFFSEEGAKDFIEWLDGETSAKEKKNVLQTIVDLIDKLIEKIKQAISSETLTKAQKHTYNTAVNTQATIRSEFVKGMKKVEEIYKGSEGEATEMDKAASAKAYSVAVGSEPSYMISDDGEYATDKNGDRVEVIDISDIVPDSKVGTAKLQQELKNALLAIRNTSVVIKSDNREVIFDKRFVKKYTYGPDMSHLEENKKRAKLGTGNKIKEIVSEAKNPVWEKNKKIKNEVIAKRGLTKYDISFLAKDGEEFSEVTGKLVVRMDEDGNDYAYDIDNINMEVAQTHNSRPEVQPPSKAIISQSGENARDNSKKIEKDSEGRELTPEQQEYFKDSKIVDENGDLRVVYHGTSEDFTVFDSNKSRANMDIQGSFFSPWEIDAEGYGEKVGEYYLNITNPAPEGIAYKTLNKYKGQNNAGIKARDELERLGYDGVNNGDEEYIAFYPEQIKLVSNNTPTNNPDIRYSVGLSASDSTDAKDLVKENDNLKELVKSLKEEFTLTDGKIPDEKKIHRVAKSLLDRYNSTYDLDMFEDNIKKIYEYLNTDGVSYDEAFSVMADVARAVIEKSSRLDTSAKETYQDVIDYIKKTPISLTEDQKKEVAYAFGSYKEFYNHYHGKLNLRSDGTSLEGAWQDLSHLHPEIFTDDTLSENMAIELADLIDNIQPKAVAMGDMDIEQASYALAGEIYTELAKVPRKETFADKKQEEKQKALERVIKTCEQYLEDFTNEVHEANKQSTEEAKARINKQRAKVLAQLKDQYLAEKARKREAKNPKTLAEYQARMDKLEKEMQRIKSVSADKLAVVKRENAQYRTRYTEQRRMTETKQKIRKLHDKLTKMIVKPTETAYVPHDLMNAAVAVCESVEPYSEGTKLRKALDAARRAFPKVSDDAGILASDFDPRIADEIDMLASIIDEKDKDWTIKDATLEELTRIYEAMNGVYESIRMSTKLIREEGEADARAAGRRWMQEIKESKGVNTKLGKLSDKITSSFLNAYREFRKLSGYKDNGEIMNTYRELNNGQKKSYWVEMEGNERLNKKLGDSKAVQKMLEKLDTDLVTVPLRFKTKDGSIDTTPVKITRGMRLSLIMHGKSQSNMNHMMHGGLVIPADMKAKTKKKAYDEVRNVVGVNGAAIAQMEAELTAEEKKILEAYQDLFWNWSGDKVNETSNALYGFEKARVSNYFPIYVDKAYVAADISALKFDKTIEGAGFLKERVVSNNPIVLDSINDVADKTIKSTALFNGLAVPIRNFNKILNTGTYELSEADADELGKEGLVKNSEGKKLHYVASDSVKNQLRQKWGKRAQKFIDDMVADLQKARVSEGTWYDKIRGNYAGAVLTANASVIIKQTSAYPTVAGITGWAPTVKALFRGGKNNWMLSKADVELINKYTPLYWYRNQGNNSRDLADIRDYGGVVNKVKPVKFAKDLIQKVDIAMVGRFWYAAQYYVNSNYKHLEKGSDAYYRKVAEIFDRAVEETQSTNMTLQNADIMRNPNAGMKMITMFMGQGLQNFGIVYDNLANYRAKLMQVKSGECTKEDVKRAGKDLANAITSQLASAVMFAGLAVVARALLHRMNPYRDDKQDITADSIASKFSDDLIDNILGSIPFGNLAYEGILTGVEGLSGKGWSRVYGQQDIVLGAISDLESSLAALAQTIGKLGDNKSADDVAEALNKVLFAGSKIIGVPYENVWNLGNGAYKHIQDVANGEGFLSFSSDKKDASAKVLGQYLTQAIQDKDTQAQETYAELLAELGKDEKQINEEIKKNILDDERIIKAANAKDKGDLDTYDNTVSALAKEGYPEKAVTDAIKKLVNDKNKQPDKKNPAKPIDGSFMKGIRAVEVKKFSNNDIVTAVENNNKTTLQKLIDDKISEKKAAGLNQAEAEKEVRKNIRTPLTRAYKERYQTGSAKEKTDIIKLLEGVKIGNTPIYNQDDFKKWNKSK